MKTNIALLIEQAANVIDSLNTGIRLTQDEQMFICEHFIREKVKKNDFTIKSGDYENYIYFIEAGFLRYWTICHQKNKQFGLLFLVSSQVHTFHSKIKNHLI